MHIFTVSSSLRGTKQSLSDRQQTLIDCRAIARNDLNYGLSKCHSTLTLLVNHIHLVAVPARESSLQQVLKPLHMRYAQRINRIMKWSGHFWQGRYFSSPMDESYMWSAIRYVERNPVCARMVRKAEDYPWSSAANHCGRADDRVLSKNLRWKKLTEQVDDWSAWLTEGDDPSELTMIRRNIEKGLPCGSDRFIKNLEKKIGRSLQYRPQGRPPRDD